MANTNYLSQENVAYVRSLIDANTSLDDLLRETSMTPDELTEVFIKLRKKGQYRVFLGNCFHEPSLCNYENYMKQMNYADRIDTNNEPVKLLICSDMHLCSTKDRPDLVYKVWDKAIELGISHIIDLGDVTEGTEYHLGKSDRSSIKIPPTLEAQITYLDKYLPYDKSITHHVLLGNHDVYSTNAISIDLFKELQDRYPRPDIVMSGVDNIVLPINNDCIHLLHRPYHLYVSNYLRQYEESYEQQIMFCGHAHISKTISGGGYWVEYVPPLANDPKGNDEEVKNNFIMGFTVATIQFNCYGKIDFMNIEYYYFDNDMKIEKYKHDNTVHVRRLIK